MVRAGKGESSSVILDPGSTFCTLGCGLSPINTGARAEGSLPGPVCSLSLDDWRVYVFWNTNEQHRP